MPPFASTSITSAQINQSWLSVLNATSSTSEFLVGSNPQNNCPGNGVWFGVSENYNFKLNSSGSRIVLTGASNCSPFLSVLNTSNGLVIYDKYLNNLQSNVGLGVAFDNSDNLYTTASNDNGNSNTYLHKYNNLGTLQFSTTVVDPPNTQNTYYNLCINQNNQILMYGKAYVNANPYNTHHVKSFSLLGVPQWSTSIIDLDWWYGYVSRMTLDNNGNVIFCGKRQTNQSQQNSYDVVVKKVNPAGLTIWQVYYDFNNVADYLNSITTDSNGDIYLLTVNTNAFTNGTTTRRLVKLNGSTGAIIFQLQVGNNNGIAEPIKINANGTIVLISDDILKCYNSTNGNILWTRTLVNPRGLNNDLNGKLFVTCSNKILVISSSGAALDSISISMPGSTIKHRYVVPEPNGNSFYVVAETTAPLPTKALVAKYCFTPQLPSNVTPTVNLTICSGNSTTLNASGSGNLTWYSSPTSSVSVGTGTNFITPILNSSTTFYIAARTCAESATRTSVSINVLITPTITLNSGIICNGQSFTITPGGASTFTIQGGSAVKTPTVTSTYTASGTGSNGCISQSWATSTITVNQNPAIVANSGTICNGQSFTITPNGASTYTIQGGSAVKTPTTSTSYTVIGTSSVGCVSQSAATSSVTVNQNPIIAVDNLTICAGQSATLNASGAATYTWNTNANTASIVVSPSNTSNYSVSGTSNSCTSTQTVQLLVSPCTGINELQAEQQLSISPNPNSGEFIITAETSMQIKISDNLGRHIKTIEVKPGKNAYQLNDLSIGVYLLSGEANGKIYKGKMVIN